MAYRPKEACVLVFDACMSAEGTSRILPRESRFEVGKKLADHYLKRFLQENRKTDQVGIVIVGGSGEEMEGAKEIEMLQSASAEHRTKLAAVQHQDQEGDITGALQLAVDKIEERVKHYKFKRTICIVTDGTSVKSHEELQSIRDQFCASDMASFEVILVDAIDSDQEGSYERCDGQKILREVFGVEAIVNVTVENAFRPHKRAVGQVKKWSGLMEVSPYCKFHVIMVARIAEEKLKPLEKRSKIALDDITEQDGPEEADKVLQNGGATVALDRRYGTAEDLQSNIPPEERSRGFRYGKDIYAMGPADEEAMKLEGKNLVQMLSVHLRTNYQK